MGKFFCRPGEVLTLMGPSGCGKSTLFARMIGALADTFRAEGELWLNKRRCDGLATEARRIGILFQDALLFDHFSVGHNLQLALPAEIRGAARQSEVEQALARAGMPGFASRDPATLSGGQRARVSLLRALLARPQALLLDEPFNRRMQNFAPIFASGCLRKLTGWQSRRSRDSRQPDLPPGGRCINIAAWQANSA